jgi:hypothetical protein
VEAGVDRGVLEVPVDGAPGVPVATTATPLIAGLVRRPGIVSPEGMDSVAMLRGSMAHAAIAASRPRPYDTPTIELTKL